MLDAAQRKLLDQLLASLSAEQRVWLTGYLNGLTQDAAAGAGASAVPLAIYYATETGNSKSVAHALEKRAKAAGFKPRLTPLGRAKPEELGAVSPAVFLTSTHGEGDPPEMARRFFEALQQASAISFGNLQYALLGLGDRAYAQFCQTAVALDEALKAGGAKAFHPIALYDVDFAAHTSGWIDGVLAALTSLTGASAGASHAAAKTHHAAPVDGRGFSRLSPLTGVIKDIVNLNDVGSRKETYHIEIEFAEPLAYSPGDAAGIILPALADGTVPVPRLYSIASSPLLYPRELHLTVALASYTQTDGTLGYGLCSQFLAQLQPGDEVPFYVQRNLRFKLPEDDAKDIIMIGPGTGIAPFRAFVQERAERGASGRNWLFFGEQHAHCDFLYQAEWQEFVESGSLSRIDLAFSRDQKEKIYVQHRLRQHGELVMDWLDNGASLYVCGSKSPMSEDVEEALLELVALRHADARGYLDQMSEEDRYVKDVY
ncbi:MAG: flavodoxin domain-containing protein [Alphaproteobacteria bacterium]|nr:flavodoxin domain-containing protein [Alphaproteobacteria bacterium]